MRLSYSSIDTYKTCPLKYKFSAIDLIKTPKSKEAVFGTVVHATMKFIHTPGLLSPSLEQALDYFSRNWNSDIFKEEIEERAAFSQGVSIIQNYYRKNDIVQANIVDLESRFNIEVEGHTISGIIDRIDKTEDGYEIVDYKTAKKMPSQEKVDNDLQLSIYLLAFLSRYPKEKENLDKLKVSLYFLKHGVKLSSTRTRDQLENCKKDFLEIVSKIEEKKFEPTVSPLCGWCGYQKMCPMWRHKFKEKRKIDSEEISKAINEYINLKSQLSTLKSDFAELQEKISEYMYQEGVERVFGEGGIIARLMRKTYKYDPDKLKAILEPLGKWEEILKIDGVALNKSIKALSSEKKKEIESAKILDKEIKSFSFKKTNESEDEEEI